MATLKSYGVATLLGLGLTATAWCQNVVQQPAFNFNTVTTTVTAPDGGTVPLGGVMRASSGRTERGIPILGKMPYLGRLFNNRGIGQDYSTGQMTVTPRIIILEEEEEKLGLGGFGTGAPAVGGPGGGVLSSGGTIAYGQTPQLTPADKRAMQLSQHVNYNFNHPRTKVSRPDDLSVVSPPKLPSPEEIRRRNELAAQTRSTESVQFFEKGQAAEDAGKKNVAKIYYQMAARRATGDFKEVILKRLDAVQGQ